MRRSRSNTGPAGFLDSPEAAVQSKPGEVPSAPDSWLDDGDEVSWTAGRETFCPVKFHSFEVGPVTVTTRVRPRESAKEAIARAKAVALDAWPAEYEAKLAGHLARIRDAAKATSEASGR